MIKPGSTIGPYTLVRKIGQGGFGVVWLADKSSRLTSTRVALKITTSDDMDITTIKREADIWVAASGHPNVLPIVDADIYDELVVIASEFAPDGSLFDWLKFNGGKAPSVESAVEMMKGILSGLEHLHSRRIVHRDLKPQNVILQGNTPRLADFGISRVINTVGRQSTVMGTPSYMAPEAFDGKRLFETGIWSAGVIFYQLLTASLPFPQQEYSQIFKAILTADPEQVPDSVPPHLRKVISTALNKEPQNRYRSAAEMLHALTIPVQSGIDIHPDAGPDNWSRKNVRQLVEMCQQHIGITRKVYAQIQREVGPVKK